MAVPVLTIRPRPGDLLFIRYPLPATELLYGYDGSVREIGPVVEVPAGWTLLYSSGAGAGAVAWRWCDGSEADHPALPGGEWYAITRASVEALAAEQAGPDGSAVWHG